MKLLALLFSLLAGPALVAGDLIVEVVGKKGQEGILYIGLCDDMATMKDFDKVTLGKTIKLNNEGKATVKFRGLREGDYALKIFLDQNGNRKLDTNILGIPREPYGLSNNIKPRFSMPKWNKLKFDVQKGTTIQKIELRG